MESPKPYCVTDGIEFPDWLFDAALCETDKQSVKNSQINNFVNEKLLPVVAFILNHPEGLHATATHIHFGGDGLKPHDHLPHEYTSVLYYEDNPGELVLHLGNGDERIRPAWGRFVLMEASLVHSVEASDGLRLSLVTNYATKPI